jgi:cytochrome b-561
LIHASFHTIAVVCFSLGLSAVVAGNNQTNKNTATTGYYPDFFSLHSFIGLAAIILYCQNYVFGFFFFLFPRATERVRAEYVRYHIPLGYLFLVTATAAICAGAMELATEYACFPASETRDVNTTENYMDMPTGCKVINGVGLLALIASLLTLFTIIDLRQDERLESVADPRNLLI